MDNIIKVKVGDNTYGIMAGGSAIITLSNVGWTFDPTSGGYIQTVDVKGINATTTCVLDINVNKIENVSQAYAQWSNVFNAVTINKDDNTGQIIFYAKEPLTENLSILVKW